MWARWCITVMAAALISANTPLAFARGSQVAHDDPWNPEHLEHLPPEVRHAVSRMCGESPRAGHYFATYFEDSRVMRLHFEHLHCDAFEFLRAKCLSAPGICFGRRSLSADQELLRQQVRLIPIGHSGTLKTVHRAGTRATALQRGLHPGLPVRAGLSGRPSKSRNELSS
jgi:hypothetical protein